MGTRSLTVFVEEDGVEIAVLYRQMDGYPTGHGEELAEFLRGKRIVNGVGGGDDMAMIFNGIANLAVQTIAHFADGPLGFYLYPAGTRETGEEYVYTVSSRNGRPWLSVKDGYPVADRVLFEGFPEDFAAETVEEAANA